MDLNEVFKEAYDTFVKYYKEGKIELFNEEDFKTYLSYFIIKLIEEYPMEPFKFYREVPISEMSSVADLVLGERDLVAEFKVQIKGKDTLDKLEIIKDVFFKLDKYKEIGFKNIWFILFDEESKTLYGKVPLMRWLDEQRESDFFKENIKPYHLERVRDENWTSIERTGKEKFCFLMVNANGEIYRGIHYEKKISATIWFKWKAAWQGYDEAETIAKEQGYSFDNINNIKRCVVHFNDSNSEKFRRLLNLTRNQKYSELYFDNQVDLVAKIKYGNTQEKLRQVLDSYPEFEEGVEWLRGHISPWWDAEKKILKFLPPDKLQNLYQYLKKKSLKIFMAMPFGISELDEIYETYIKKPLEQRNHNVMRVDDIPRPGSITEEIIKSISEADIIIADLTLRKPNVFYEAGFAHAIRGHNKVILLSQEGEKIPFDIHYLWIIFYTLKNIKETLMDELLRVVDNIAN